MAATGRNAARVQAACRFGSATFRSSGRSIAAGGGTMSIRRLCRRQLALLAPVASGLAPAIARSLVGKAHGAASAAKDKARAAQGRGRRRQFQRTCQLRQRRRRLLLEHRRREHLPLEHLPLLHRQSASRP